MDITVNEKQGYYSFKDPKTIGELIHNLMAEVTREDQVITLFTINGAEIAIQELMESMENIDPAADIVIETSNPRQLALEALEILPEFATHRIDTLTEVVDLLRTQKVQEAMDIFLPVIDDFKWLSLVISSLDSVLGLDLEVLELSDFVVAEKRDKMLDIYSEILDSLEMEDFILLADLLEYELKEELAYWEEITPVIMLMAQRPSN